MSIRDLSLRAYWACERRIAPGVRYALNDYEDALREVLGNGQHWLDIGCGKRILPAWRQAAEAELASRAASLTGIDLDHPSLRENHTVGNRVLGSGERLPFAAEAFDLVTANMVIEHVADPESQIREIFRVLRPGGVFLFHTPNRRGYPTRLARVTPEFVKIPLISLLDGRRRGDVFPTHYRANTAEEIEVLAAASGFEVQSLRHIVSSAMSSVILPLAVVELLFIRMLTRPRFARHRHTLIVALRKPREGEGVERFGNGSRPLRQA